jgi:multidrug efflux pump subunit AcrA (membrane-fusion protein)
MTDIAARIQSALEGRYTIDHEIGAGGMATVYLAHDVRHDRKVAVKVLRPELAVVIGAERFLTEIKTTANLQHPHILPLHDSGEADSFLFYVMPYVQGESLRDRLESETQLQVITHIPESLVLEISIGNKLPVYIPAAELEIVGIVQEVAPTADTRSRTAQVKLTIPSQSKIRSGQFARVSLPGTRGSAVLLPETALHPFGQMERVFIVKDQIARLRLVKTGLRHDRKIEILSGIEPGEQIIVSADTKLQDGQPVTLQ